MLRYYVFGAHSRGQTTAIYLRKLHPDWEFRGYLYDNDEVNPRDIDGIPVLNPKDLTFEGDERVYIGTRGIYHEQINKKLKELGVKDIVPVNVDLDIELRGAFVSDYFREKGREFTRIEELIRDDREKIRERHKQLSSCVLVVKSSVDSPIRINVSLRPYEHYIQAGAAISGRTLSECEFFDDEREEISGMNRQFCELTALYWIWKNVEYEVKGIEHYRRRFILPEQWSRVFDDKLADVILPVPLYVRPSIEGNYIGRHNSKPWEAMIRVLCERNPVQGIAAQEFFSTTGCYSPCNMLIARKEVLDDLCSWMFPILFEVKELCGEYDDPYQNRYPGFLAERLITFFFYLKSDQYKVAYADKSFIEN